MKYLVSFSIVLAVLFSTSSLQAKDCAVTIGSNDAMQYTTKEMTVPAGCTKMTVTLKHNGKLPKVAMGHNWVLTKDGDFMAVASAGAAAGPANNYLTKGDKRVLFATTVIGGGESTSVVVDLSALKKGEKYKFFCSFPGHFAIMNGAFIYK